LSGGRFGPQLPFASDGVSDADDVLSDAARLPLAFLRKTWCGTASQALWMPMKSSSSTAAPTPNRASSKRDPAAYADTANVT
jgi:hypothetical protein